MGKNETINVRTHSSIAAQFRKVAEGYEGRLGMCLSAAMLMFMQAHPEVQGEFLKRVFEAQIRDQVEKLIEQITQEQADKVKAKASEKKQRLEKA